MRDRLLWDEDGLPSAASGGDQSAGSVGGGRSTTAARFDGASPLLSSSPFPFVLARRSRRASLDVGVAGSPADRRTIHGFSAPGAGLGEEEEAEADAAQATTSARPPPALTRTSSSLTAAVAAAAAARLVAEEAGGGLVAAVAPPPLPPPSPALAAAAAAAAAPAREGDLEAPPVPASPRAPAAGAGAGAGASPPPSPPPPPHRAALALALGSVNGLVGLPTMVAFAAIVYKDRLFTPDLGALARLAFLASGLQQAVFSLRSRLPYAVGQVQDVGLILLSSMASDVAARCRADPGVGRDAAVAAAVWAAAVATLAVGAAVTAIGHWQLASYSAGVPLSVVGGYLGFVGAFCGVAGLGLTLGGGEAPASVGGWVAALGAPGAPARVGAALATAGLLTLIMRRARSPAALPLALGAIPLAFHALRLAAGVSLKQAAAAGWTLPPEPPGGGSPAAVYRLFSPAPTSGTPLRAALAQAPRAVALAGVVMFGACLDVSAIAAAEAGSASATPALDINREVVTVGLSNVLAGAAGGGFTGSWIFSQTLFSARAGVAHRWAHGAAIAALELAAFASPLSIIPYLPAFFVASLLLVFAAGILEDYLIRTRARLSGGEYALLWATFGAIVVLGLEVGIAAGIAAATADFAYRFARIRVVVTPVAPSRAAAARPPADRALLSAFRSRRAVAVSLGGYVFFGSALALSDHVLTVARALAAEAAAGVGEADGGSESVGGGGWGGGGGSALRPATPTPQPDPTALAVAWRAAPLFLLLDFRAVRGLDATAAQAFAALARATAGVGVTLVLCHLRDARAVRLLASHGFEVDTLDEGGPQAAKAGVGAGAAGSLLASAVMVVDGAGPGAAPAPSAPAPAFDSADDAVWAAEEAFLAVARAAGALLPPPDTGLGLEAALKALLVGGGGTGRAAGLAAPSAAAAAAAPFFEVLRLPPGGLLWSAGDPADSLALILEGTLVSEVRAGGAAAPSTTPVLARLPASLRPAPAAVRRSHAGPGSTLGVGTCFARARRPGDAVAATPAVVARLSRPALDALRAASPAAAATLLTALLRVQALEASQSLAVLELSAAAAVGG